MSLDRTAGTRLLLDQVTATRVLEEYLDHLEVMQKEGPLRFQEAFANSPSGVGVHEIDTGMRVMRVNPEELKILGYRAQDVVGRIVWEIIVMQDASRRAIRQKLTGERELKPFVRSFRRS